MAKRSHTMRSIARANFDERKVAKEAEVLLTTIERLSKHIGKLMQEAHGGQWRVQIEHDDEFITIARSAESDRVIAKSSLREAM